MPSPPLRWPRSITLRWHLVWLVVGALLPVVAFASVVVLQLAGRERAEDEAHLAESASALATTVEREMSATIRTLRALAESERLDRDDLDGFRDEARRVQGTQPSWVTVILLAPDGQQVVDTRRPRGEALARVVEPESLRRLVATQEPVVGDLARSRPEEAWAFPIRVPVVRDGALRYVLTAVISTEALAEVVRRAPLPEEWARSVVDGRGLVVARSRAPERFVGTRGTDTYLRHIRGAPSELYRDITMDGTAAYVAFHRVPTLAWTVGVAVPVEVVDGPLRRSMLAVVGAGLGLLLLSGAGAFLLSRRVTRGIVSATAAADALAHGGRPLVEPSAIAEVARLGDALARSADLLAQRARERDDLLARAEAARAEAERANRDKDEFLAMLGHELRNPLAPIVMALKLLELRGEGGAREHGIIQRQVQHLVRMVDDLLDVSRITRGKVELRKERIEIAAAVGKAVEMVQPLADQKRHALAVAVPEEGLAIDADPLRIAQVIANLLTNAIRYTKAGGHLRVEARREGDAVVLAVTDDGEGIAADVLPRVFDLFVQGPRSSDRQQGGLGIGLTLAQRLVVLHGGRIEAHSDGPGRGSTFVVKLPAPAVLGAAPPPAAAGLPAREAAAPRRVLVVDDNVDAATLLGEVFAKHGHTVETAHDGPSALDVLDRFVPEVAVLDIGLPILDGYALAGKIRDRLGASAPMLVAVTGYGQEHDRARSQAAGFRCHFVKPVDPEALLAAIGEAAGR